MSKYNTISWLESFSKGCTSALCKVSGRKAALETGFETAAELFKKVRKHNKAIWWIGNGGSSSICSHLAQDVMNKLGIRTMAISDASLLTCIANDYGYENVYAKPLEILAQEGDLLIAISSSGRSPNILACTKLARKKKMELITLSGFDESNPLWDIPAAVSFYFPSQYYGQVESGHGLLLHAVIETIWLNERQNIRSSTSRG